MDEKRLAELEKLVADASQGENWYPFEAIPYLTEPHDGLIQTNGGGEVAHSVPIENARFVVDSINAVPELVAEVRRLRKELAAEKLRTGAPLTVMLDPAMPPGTAAMVSGDQVAYLHGLHSEDMREARREERERCLGVIRERLAEAQRIIYAGEHADQMRDSTVSTIEDLEEKISALPD